MATERHYEDDAVADIRDFLLNDRHWIYRSKGTPSEVNPDSVFHVGQLEVLFESRYFHNVTNRAISRLRQDGFLQARARVGENNVTLLWRYNLRYYQRKIRDHLELVSRYSNADMNDATGRQAEALTQLGFANLGLRRVDRNTNSYGDMRWIETDHDLDFIFEGNGIGYGIEVKNTFDYIPDEELQTKLNICAFLGLRPLFVVRFNRPSQRQKVQEYGGEMLAFRTKIFPLGQKQLVKDIWEQMRLPVQVWDDWQGGFYKFFSTFLTRK